MKKMIVVLFFLAVIVVTFTVWAIVRATVGKSIFVQPIGLLAIGAVVRAKDLREDENIKSLLKNVNVNLLNLWKDEFSKPTVLKYAILVLLGVFSDAGYIPRFSELLSKFSELLRMINKAEIKVTKGTLKNYIYSLEKKGYIKLVREGYMPGEGYVTKVQLTEKGKTRCKELIKEACKNYPSLDKVMESDEGDGNHG